MITNQQFARINHLITRLGHESTLNQKNHQSWNKNNKPDSKTIDLVTSTDLFNNQQIIQLIQELFPNDNIVSEECAFIQANEQHNFGFIWYIDPLDGTREFHEGLDEWCIQICRFSINDNKPDATWIWEARNNGTLWAWHSQLKQIHITPNHNNHINLYHTNNDEQTIFTISRGHPDTWTQQIISNYQQPYCTIKSGSAGVKVCRILRNEATTYANGSGKMKVWDWAAPYALAYAYNLCYNNEIHILYMDTEQQIMKPWIPNFESYQTNNNNNITYKEVHEKLIFSSKVIELPPILTN